MDISTKIAESLARRSSRRQFFKLLGAGSLGAGLFLTRHRRLAGRDDGLRRLRRRALQPVWLAGTAVREHRSAVQALRSRAAAALRAA